MEIKLTFETDYDIRVMVEDFLKNKIFETEYEISFIDKEDEREYITRSKFSEKEILQIKDLVTKYGMENIHTHLSEVFGDPDILSDTFINPDSVISIDLDHPIKLMRLNVNRFIDGKIKSNCIQIKIHPNDYRNLLVHCVEDSGMNFNKLRHADPGIYERMLCEIDNCISLDGYYSDDYPYFITLPEIDQDVTEFLKEHTEIIPGGSIGYSLIF